MSRSSKNNYIYKIRIYNQALDLIARLHASSDSDSEWFSVIDYSWFQGGAGADFQIDRWWFLGRNDPTASGSSTSCDCVARKVGRLPSAGWWEASVCMCAQHAAAWCDGGFIVACLSSWVVYIVCLIVSFSGAKCGSWGAGSCWWNAARSALSPSESRSWRKSTWDKAAQSRASWREKPLPLSWFPTRGYIMGFHCIGYMGDKPRKIYVNQKIETYFQDGIDMYRL